MTNQSTVAEGGHTARQLDLDLDMILSALEFYQLAVGGGLSIENSTGHTNDPADAFFDYYEASGLSVEDGDYDRIPKRIYDRLRHAVNCHDDLLEALERISSGRSSVTECALIARAVISKARPVAETSA